MALGPTIIVFTGIDGSGKSTHARRLADLLRDQGLEAFYVHQFEPTSPLVGALRDRLWTGLKRLKALVARPGDAGDGRGLGPLALALGVYGALAALHRTAVKVRAHRRADVLVFDRYFHDDLLRLAFDFGVDLPWAWNLQGALPEPDLILYLDLPVDEALAREKDGDLEPDTIVAKKALYDEWYGEARDVPWAPRILRVDTSRDREEVSEEIVAVALNVLGGPVEPLVAPLETLVDPDG